jgi:multidrug efflux pump subunit AcrA (membrane-fusion protein)
VARDPARAAIEKARVEAQRARERYYAACAAQLSPPTPIAGVILTPRLREKLGTSCEAGDTLYVVGEMATLQAEILLDERSLGLVDADCAVQLRTYGQEGEVRHGQIELIAPLPAVKRARQMYRVRVRVPNPNGDLRPGMRGVARFESGQSPALAQLLAGAARVLRIEFWL